MNTRIGIFSFNSAGINYCSGPKKGFFCKDSRFVSDVCLDFTSDQCDIVAVGLQESSMPNDGLIDYFQNSLQNSGYKILKVEKMLGFGAEGFLGFIRGLRLIVAYGPRIQKMTLVDVLKTSCRVQKKGKGALGFLVNIQIGKKEEQMIIATAHLPFLGNKPDLYFGLEGRKECLDEIYEMFTRNNVPMILFGDLNFRLAKSYKPLKLSETQDFTEENNNSNIIDKIDELVTFLSASANLGGKAQDTLRYLFENNIQDKTYNNPLKDYYLVPSCKLKTKRDVKHCDEMEKSENIIVGREGQSIRKFTTNLKPKKEVGFDPKCYSLEKNKIERTPSFCDRILFEPQTFQPVKFKTLDQPGINLSDHRAIYGVFTLLSKESGKEEQKEESRKSAVLKKSIISEKILSNIGIFSFNTSDYKYCKDNKCENVEFVDSFIENYLDSLDIFVIGIYESRSTFIQGFLQRFKSMEHLGNYFVKKLDRKFKIVANESIVKNGNRTTLIIAYRKYKNIDNMRLISLSEISCNKNVGFSALLELYEKGNQQRFIVSFGNLEEKEGDLKCLLEFYKQLSSKGQMPTILFGDLNFGMVYDQTKKFDVDELIEIFEIINEKSDENIEVDEKLFFEIKNQNDVLRFAVDKFNQERIAKDVKNDQFIIIPSCHLKKNRNVVNCLNKYDNCYDKTPAYCDRMLYTEKTFVPILFETIDGNGIENSSHRAIFGIFEFL